MKTIYAMIVPVLLSMVFLTTARAADKPNILFIVSDDTGYGDLGPYGGGEGRGMPTPNIDRMAREGMTFFPFTRNQVARPVAPHCKPVVTPTAVA